MPSCDTRPCSIFHVTLETDGRVYAMETGKCCNLGLSPSGSWSPNGTRPGPPDTSDSRSRAPLEKENKPGDHTEQARAAADPVGQQITGHVRTVLEKTLQGSESTRCPLCCWWPGTFYLTTFTERHGLTKPASRPSRSQSKTTLYETAISRYSSL